MREIRLRREKAASATWKRDLELDLLPILFVF
jgi:hypothetical protein